MLASVPGSTFEYWLNQSIDELSKWAAAVESVNKRRAKADANTALRGRKGRRR